MKPSTSLFDLIRSLTKSEKRYFRLYAELQKGSKNYLKLFDQIEKMKVYDEAGLKRSYSRLTFTKSYLYDAIIKSLKAYSIDRSPGVKMQEQLIKLKVLYNRSLFRQFYKVLAVLKEQSKELEDFTVYHELLKLEIQSIKTGEHKDSDQIKILNEIGNVLQVIGNLNEFSLASAVLRESARNHGIVRDSRSFARVAKIIESPAIKKGITESSTNREKDAYHRTMSNYVYITGGMEKLVSHNLARLETVRKNPRIFEEDTVLRLIEIYGALFYGLVKLNRFEEFDLYFTELKALNARTSLEKGMLFSKTSLYELLYLLKAEEYYKGVSLIPRIEKDLKIHEPSIQKDDILILYYYICRIYFGAGDYSKALEYSNILLNHPHIEYRSDVHIYCRILDLIIHYELGNFDLMPYIIRSVYRFLYKKGKVFRFEKMILKFLKELKYSASPGELRRRLIVLKADLLLLQSDPYEKNVFIYFELLSWIDRKIKAQRTA